MTDPIERTRIEIALDQLIRRDRITRRTFMRRVGRGVVAVGALSTVPGIMAACQPGEEGSSTVRWLNWPAYMDLSEDESTFPSIEAFTEQTGLEVEYNEGLLDNADFLAQYSPDLNAGNNTGWDVMRRKSVWP